MFLSISIMLSKHIVHQMKSHPILWLEKWSTIKIVNNYIGYKVDFSVPFYDSFGAIILWEL